MSNDSERKTIQALQSLARDAESRAATMKPVDVDTILRRAGKQNERETGHRIVHWVTRAVVAAATLAVGVGILLIARPRPVPVGPVPEHLVSLVDSLYPATNYVHDDLGDYLWPDQEDTNGYMNDVWDTVVSEMDES